jgi:hypothetical protein
MRDLPTLKNTNRLVGDDFFVARLDSAVAKSPISMPHDHNALITVTISHFLFPFKT